MKIYGRSFVYLCGALAALASAFPPSGIPQEPLIPVSEIPVATRNDRIADILRKWYSEGTAAGNTGDFYDNRDGGHSMLKLALYPQLQRIEYTDEQKRTKQHWGMQSRILPNVVFGNSSTSGAPERGGSNIRGYYVNPQGLSFLFTQYTHNNLYIYPEHRDYDPGRNGVGGYGDLYPTNTPYLIASHGSSGSDQVFLHAVSQVLAAFRPEVKKRLIQSGLLMPSIQMILRATQKDLANSKEYLTGKAHPTVFQGSKINVMAMVEMAHGITLSNLPPIVWIRTVREDTPANGTDYFEPERTENLADTPGAIARIFRGSSLVRKITVSAEDSRDLNNRPLSYYWAVLRGDASRIKINYLNPSRSIAEITVPYHERRPIEDGSSMESNRVDIGVFVHNGAYYSPPSFITFYFLNNEARTYLADGRPLEIAYGVGTPAISVVDWTKLFQALAPASESWQCGFLKKPFAPEEITALLKVGEEYRHIHETLLKTQEDLKSPDHSPHEMTILRKALAEAREAEKEVLQKKLQRLNLGAYELVHRSISTRLQDPNLWTANAKEIEPLYEAAGTESRQALNEIREKLLLFGVADKPDGSPLRMKLLKDEKAPLTGAVTRYEKGMIERLNALLLSRIIFPGIVDSAWKENYVDHRIASAKEWRDIYRYAPDGTLLGWKRYRADGVTEFNPEGHLVLKQDSQARCTLARAVRYELQAQERNPKDLRRKIAMVQTDAIREYEYDGPSDWKGHGRN
jgi:hypothetical protein